MQAICEAHYCEELNCFKLFRRGRREAANIIAEIGVDMKMTLTASAIVGWVALNRVMTRCRKLNPENHLWE